VVVPLATNLAIDDRLIDEARRIGKKSTKKAAVTEALEEYIQRRRQLQVLELFGAIDLDPSLRLQAAARAGVRIIVDTCVWSMALPAGDRRQRLPKSRNLRQLIDEGSGPDVGADPSGDIVRNQAQESSSRNCGTDFGASLTCPLSPRTTNLPPSISRHFARRASQGSNTDCLICAVSVRRNPRDPDYGTKISPCITRSSR